MESGNGGPFLFWALVVVIMVCMATFLYLLSYLRRVHNPFWVDMGSISLQNFAEKNPIQSFSDSFRLLGLFFGSRYKSLNDPKVGALVWTVRLLLTTCFVLWAFVMFPLL